MGTLASVPVDTPAGTPADTPMATLAQCTKFWMGSGGEKPRPCGYSLDGGRVNEGESTKGYIGGYADVCTKGYSSRYDGRYAGSIST